MRSVGLFCGGWRVEVTVGTWKFDSKDAALHFGFLRPIFGFFNGVALGFEENASDVGERHGTTR